MITQNKLKELLHYDPETGLFTRLVTTAHHAKAGQVAGSVGHHGYIVIRIEGKLYLAHRLAWLYCSGNFPQHGIDHINRVTNDNRLSNLRPANQLENGQNQVRRKNNASGHTGVSWWNRNNKWRAGITVNRKNINLGYFSKIEDAVAAYAEAKSRLHTFNPVQTTDKQAALS